MDDTYRVCVQGHLDDRWSDWFGGLAVQRQPNGTTLLVGPVGDQAGLHGAIERIRDLGLTLISVNRDIDLDGLAQGDAPVPSDAPEREGQPSRS